MKILIVEDHFLVRKSLIIILKEAYSNAILLEADNYQGALRQLTDSTIDLLILDIGIPGGIGTAMIKEIKELHSTLSILICSAADEEEYALDYIVAGANGYLSKSAHESEVVTAISTVLDHKRYISPAVQERLLEVMTAKKTGPGFPSGVKRLSDRENEIMQLLLEGKGTKEIAHILHLYSNTISTFKARIFEKMGVTNLLELSKKANQLRH